jgi:hypothetical protein
VATRLVEGIVAPELCQPMITAILLCLTIMTIIGLLLYKTVVLPCKCVETCRSQPRTAISY